MKRACLIALAALATVVCGLPFAGCGALPAPEEKTKAAATGWSTSEAMVGKQTSWSGGKGIITVDSLTVVSTCWPTSGQSAYFSTRIIGQNSPTDPSAMVRAGTKCYLAAGVAQYVGFAQIAGQYSVNMLSSVSPGDWIRVRIFIGDNGGTLDATVVMDNWTTSETDVDTLYPSPSWSTSTFKGIFGGVAVERPNGTNVPAFGGYWLSVSFDEDTPGIGTTHTDPSWGPFINNRLTGSGGTPTLVTVEDQAYVPNTGAWMDWQQGS